MTTQKISTWLYQDGDMLPVVTIETDMGTERTKKTVATGEYQGEWESSGVSAIARHRTIIGRAYRAVEQIPIERWHELENDVEARILTDFYREVDQRAEATIQHTGVFAGAHYNAMKQVLKERGIEV